jgi:two-component system cell cycle sensor histidine kinase/response regulator CckA
MSDQHACSNILFVDDDAILRRTTKRLLERKGYRVWTASNGTDALNMLLLQPGQIDVVISSIVIARVGDGTRYLFTSARLTHDALGALRSRPGTGFLMKPWTIAELEASMNALVDASSNSEPTDGIAPESGSDRRSE